MEAVEKHKYTTPPEDYQPPHLEQILPFLPEGKDDPVKCLSLMAATIREDDDREFEPEFHAQGVHRVMGTTKQRKQRLLSTIRMMIDDNEDAFSLQEFRCLFLSLLRAAYAIQVNHGELEDREVLVVALETSLDFAADDVANGKPLGDWDYIHLFDSSLTAFGKIKISVIKSLRSIFGKRAFYCGVADDVQRLTIERSIAFMAAHQWAQSFMQKEFEDNGCELSELGKKVLKESQAQCQKAEAVLDEFSSDDVAVVLSRKCCLILLNSSISFM